MNKAIKTYISDGELDIRLDNADEIFLKKIMLSICAKLRTFGWNIRTPYGEKDTDIRHGKAFNKQWTEGFRCGIHSGLEFKAWICGCSLQFTFWENVNDHTSDNRSGGRYIFNKESKMPYLLCMRTHLVRKQIIEHINKHYEVAENKSSVVFPTNKLVKAYDLVQESIKSSWHYVAELGHAEITGSNDLSADGIQIKHGSPVYTLDYCGRFIKGFAYYDLNMNWNVITGKYDYKCISNTSIYVNKPDDLRVKQNAHRRRRALENEMSKAIKRMDFDKAKAVKAQLFGDEPLYHVLKGELYYRPNGSGYTNNPIDAGKYTESEVSYYRNQSELTVQLVYQEAA